MEGQARRVLENYVKPWDHTNPLNANVLPAAAREVLRVPWRQYHKLLAVYTMRLINITNLGPVPASPDSQAIPIIEPPRSEKFMKSVNTTFQATQATYLQELKEFKAMPRDSLLRLFNRCEELAIPLLGAD